LWAKASISPCCPQHGESAAGPRSGSSTNPQADASDIAHTGTAMDREGAPVDEAEFDAGEADPPVAAGALGDANGFADQDLAEEDELAAPLDLAVGVDTSHRMIAVVGRLAQRTRIAPGRGPVERRRRLLAERLMRPLLVELAAEAVEAALLGGERRRRRRG